MNRPQIRECHNCVLNNHPFLERPIPPGIVIQPEAGREEGPFRPSLWDLLKKRPTNPFRSSELLGYWRASRRDENMRGEQDARKTGVTF